MLQIMIFKSLGKHICDLKVLKMIPYIFTKTERERERNHLEGVKVYHYLFYLKYCRLWKVKNSE